METDVTFSFICVGKVRKDYAKNKSISDLSKLFDVTEDELAGLYSRKASYRKENLLIEVAEMYMDAFHKVGLVGAIVQKNAAEKQNVVLPNNRICPKCDDDLLNPEKCDGCGIYIHKYIPPENAIIQKRNEKYSEPNHCPEVDTHLDRASSIIRIATVVSLIVLTGDTAFQQSTMIYPFGFDIGVRPYIALAALIALGCFFLVRAKGYHPLVGLIGITGLFGLGVIMLLKDKHSEDRSAATRKKLILPCIYIFASVCILFSYITLEVGYSRFVLHGDMLVADREASSGIKYQNLFEAEQDISNIERYLDLGFTLIDSDLIRPNTVARICKNMFDETLAIFKRVSAGPISLDKTNEGDWRELKRRMRIIVDDIGSSVSDSGQPRAMNAYNHYYEFRYPYLDQ